jgi:hypothetical protein
MFSLIKKSLDCTFIYVFNMLYFWQVEKLYRKRKAPTPRLPPVTKKQKLDAAESLLTLSSCGEDTEARMQTLNPDELPLDLDEMSPQLRQTKTMESSIQQPMQAPRLYIANTFWHPKLKL